MMDRLVVVVVKDEGGSGDHLMHQAGGEGVEVEVEEGARLAAGVAVAVEEPLLHSW